VNAEFQAFAGREFLRVKACRRRFRKQAVGGSETTQTHLLARPNRGETPSNQVPNELHALQGAPRHFSRKVFLETIFGARHIFCEEAHFKIAWFIAN